MKPQELRIDNWVYDRSKTRIVKVWGIESNHDQITVNHANGSAIYKVNLKDIEPIELTEEWLRKFGFVIRYYNDDETFPIWWKVINNRHIDIFPHQKFNFFFLINSVQMSTPLASVHQLQNLVHSLTGEELQLKN